MKIPSRILDIEFVFPVSGSTSPVDSLKITQDQSMDVRVRCSKTIVHLQNRCSINIFGLRQDIRQRLLTAFTAWNNRKQPGKNFVQVKIFAGYSTDSISQPARIFVGDVVKCDITGSLPNSEILIEAYTRQIDRTNYIPCNIPKSATFKEIFDAVAEAGGLVPNCKTSFDKDKQTNNFAVIQVNPLGQPLRLTVQAAIAGLWRLYPDQVAIWVDDESLMARDIGRVIEGGPPTITKFVDSPPSWTEWGITFKTIFDPRIKLAGGVMLNSVMNTNVNGDVSTGYVVTSIEYELASRQRPFYVTVKATPPAK